MFLSHLKSYSWIYILLLAIIVCYYFKSGRDAAIIRSNQCSASLLQQNASIAQWKAIAEEANLKQKAREEAAANKMDNAKKEALTILADKPIGCEGSRVYGINKALEFKRT